MPEPAPEPWIDTAVREPADGALVEWTDAVTGALVRGYRMGRSGRGLWLVPGASPTYHARPAQWRPAPAGCPRPRGGMWR